MAAFLDRPAGRYDRQMDFWDRRLFGTSRPWACGRAAGALRAAQWLYERISVPLAGEHFRRRPLLLVREPGFVIEETERLGHGIVERIHARKPA